MPVVGLAAGSRATPKSMILAGRPRGRNRFEGFTSRWTMPCSWAWPEAGEEVQDDGEGELRVGPDPRLDGALEVHALEQLERHEGLPLVIAELVDGDDVRVLEPGRGLALTEEARPGVLVRLPERHDLQSHVPFERLVAPPVDRPHRPLAQEVHDLVAADSGGERGHGHSSRPDLIACRGRAQGDERQIEDREWNHPSIVARIAAPAGRDRLAPACARSCSG